MKHTHEVYGSNLEAEQIFFITDKCSKQITTPKDLNFTHKQLHMFMKHMS